MLRRISLFALVCALFSGMPVIGTGAPFQQPATFTAEQIVEGSIIIYGGRAALTQIRRNGDEHGKVIRTNSDGRSEEINYERRFIRGDSAEKDKIRLDQKTPTIEYALVTGDGKTWGMINGTAFAPKEDASAGFLSDIQHGLDTLLRYKENGSTLKLLGKDKQQNVEFYSVEVTDKDKRTTTFNISLRSLRVLSIEYEYTPPGGGTPVKYKRRFYDYRIAQGTLVPYKTILLQNGKEIEEIRTLTVTYGVKLDDSLFKNPDAPASASS